MQDFHAKKNGTYCPSFLTLLVDFSVIELAVG
jgi:hypothetical protein